MKQLEDFINLFKLGGLVITLIISSHMRSGPSFIHNVGYSSSVQLADVYLPFVSNQSPSYFVDSVGGSDSYPGTSEEKPWRSLAPVHSMNFSPGSVIHFKRGSSWSGGLVIDDSGVEGQPITFTTYGSGNKPIFRNPGDINHWTRGVQIKADWVVIESLFVRDVHEAGVYISEGADNNVVRDIEATHVGSGIKVLGQYNTITENYLHDLHMVKNTPGGNDDFGAIGVELHGSYNEVSYNKIINCIAPSYDYGVDGGALELWSSANNNYVHHNWASGNDGFLEVGGGSANNNTVAYNISVDNGKFSILHLDGQFGSQVLNFRIENNTIVESANVNGGWFIFYFNGDPKENTFIIHNNIIKVDSFWVVSNKSSFTHSYNLYNLLEGTTLGFPLANNEQIADPLFINSSGLDFRLLPTSPAINAGTDLGYHIDFDGLPVPVGGIPDVGAYEYQGP